jgi:hypothetical protein
MSIESADLSESVVLALQFFLELCALIALGYWGFKTGQGLITKIGLGLGAPLLFAVVWGVSMAPRAAVRVPDPWRLILELVLFGTAATALYVSGRTLVAPGFGLVVMINEALLYIWGLR